MSDLTLSEDEVRAVAGGYKRACDQLPELKRQGFYRARVARVTGKVVLERAHYDAVCAGREPSKASGQRDQPQVRMP